MWSLALYSYFPDCIYSTGEQTQLWTGPESAAARWGGWFWGQQSEAEKPSLPALFRKADPGASSQPAQEGPWAFPEERSIIPQSS